MNTLWHLVILLAFTQFVACRDFYLGMFRRNDFLVAQDVLYKAPSPFGYTTASYGRLFKCPITYFRVVDRLGMGRGPITTIVRGGLKNKFITVRIKSSYRLPVSVNIYVGCENKKPSTFRSPLSTTTHESTTSTTTEEDDYYISYTKGPDTRTTDGNETPKQETNDETTKEETSTNENNLDINIPKNETSTNETTVEDILTKNETSTIEPNAEDE